MSIDLIHSAKILAPVPGLDPGIHVLLVSKLKDVDGRVTPGHGVIVSSVHLLQSRTGESIIWSEKARHHIPAHPMIRAQLAAAYALSGETDRAAAELGEARRLSPDDRYSSIARLKSVVGSWGIPKVRALFEAAYFAGLRKAGMPEE